MNYLIAKTRGEGRGRAGGYFRIMSEEEPFFEHPVNLENAQPYDSNYKLEEDEWFLVDVFSQKLFSIDLLTQAFAIVEFDQIPVDNYRRIEYLSAYDEDAEIYYLQRIALSQKILRKKFFTCTAEPTLEQNKPIIVINPTPDAVYVQANDTIYFKDLSAITSIFPGIDTLFREATDAETEAFLDEDFIQLAQGYTSASVKKANRKRIAMAMQRLAAYEPHHRAVMCGYIREYYADLPYDEETNTFIISTEEELKKLIYGIDERYYTTHLGGVRRLANSVLPI